MVKKLKAPLEVTEDLRGVKIRGVTRLDINNGMYTQQIVGQSTNSYIPSIREVDVELVGEISKDTIFDDVVNTESVTLKFIMNGDYYILLT
jgi:hypothetical protein